jgi:hypothetical protein
MQRSSSSPSSGKKVSDAVRPDDAGSSKKVRVASTTGSHLSVLSCHSSSPLPMLPETSKANARCTGSSSTALDAIAHASPPSPAGGTGAPVPPAPLPELPKPPLPVPPVPLALPNEPPLGTPRPSSSSAPSALHASANTAVSTAIAPGPVQLVALVSRVIRVNAAARRIDRRPGKKVAS